MLRPTSKPINPTALDVNTIADVLGTSPAYRQKETLRWSAALQLYQQMSSHDEELSSPPNSPVNLDAANENKSLSGTGSSSESTDDESISPSAMAAINSSRDDGLAIPPAPAVDNQWSNFYSGLYSPNNPLHSLPTGRYGFLTPPVRPSNMQAPRIGGSYMSPGESSLNSLELEAIAAVHELLFAVKDIFVSELLPRTSELIFLNITTLEGQAYCIELTMKGWRVTSMRHDCMNGDFNHINLHIRYFETIYALMDNISNNYRQKFSEALSSKLQLLQNLEKLDETALAKAFEQNAALKNRIHKSASNEDPLDCFVTGDMDRADLS